MKIKAVLLSILLASSTVPAQAGLWDVASWIASASEEYNNQQNARAARRVADQKAAEEAARLAAAKRQIEQEDRERAEAFFIAIGYAIKSAYHVATGQSKSVGETITGTIVLTATAALAIAALCSGSKSSRHRAY